MAGELKAFDFEMVPAGANIIIIAKGTIGWAASSDGEVDEPSNS